MRFDELGIFRGRFGPSSDGVSVDLVWCAGVVIPQVQKLNVTPSIGPS
jgi:hypothetical protein